MNATAFKIGKAASRVKGNPQSAMGQASSIPDPPDPRPHIPDTVQMRTRTASNRMRIRNDIRRLRFDRGEMTQQDLADRIGVTRQTVIAIEQAKYSPTLELAFKIAAVFGRPLEDVFHYEADV